MSDTPRTDAEEGLLVGQLGKTVVGCVPTDFARKLERELNDNVLAEYSQNDGHRQWWSGGVWLYPGDKIVITNPAP